MIKSTNNAATSASVSLTAEDIFTKPVAINGESQISVPLQKGAGAQDISFKAPGPGYYLLHTEVHAGEDTATGSTDFGVVPFAHPGLRPDSLFASNMPWPAGPDLDLWQAIGMKIARHGLNPKIGKTDGLAPGQVPALDFSQVDEKWADSKAHDVWAIPLSEYALPGDNNKSPLALETGMFGPPNDYARFANTEAAIYAHFPEVTTIEFYNEPWLFGYTFAGTPADYDRLQKMFCEAMLKVNPNYRIVAGSSTMFAVDNIEPHPDCWKGLLQGLSNHPYVDTSDPTFRAGANARAMDAERLTAQRMGLPYSYLTEGGTKYAPPPPPLTPAEAAAKAQNKGKSAKAQLATMDKTDPRFAELKKEAKDKKAEVKVTTAINNNNIENAAKIVQYYTKAALEGMFQANAQWDIGYGDGWTHSDTTFATMTQATLSRTVLPWPTSGPATN